MLMLTGVLLAVKRFLFRRIQRILALVLVFFLWDGLRAADNPWTKKSPAKWDRADVHRILYDSPWVRHFTRTKRDLEFEVPDLGPSGIELRGYHAKESKEDGILTTQFYVRWVSSRTLRRAMAQRTVLISHSNPELAETNTPPILDDLEISIAGRDMSTFQQVRDVPLKTKCYLATTSKLKIHPTRVEFAMATDGKINGVLFHFPRTTERGEPLISSHETGVWFFEGATDIQISVMFRPQAMIDGKGLDL